MEIKMQTILRFHIIVTTILIIMLCVIDGVSQARNNTILGSVIIEPIEKWRTVFENEEYIYHFRVNASQSIVGNAGWSLRYGHRIITRGEHAFDAGPNKTGIIKIRIHSPSLKEGIMMPIQFAVVLYSKEEKKALASWEDTLNVFSRDPFVLNKKWLKSLNIGLFDPEKRTREVFENLSIPFVAQNNKNALSGFEGSLLIIGSGLDFAEYRGLWEEVIDLCSRNIPVLILNPQGGIVDIPGIEGTLLPGPIGIRFLRNEIIHKLDKTLDQEALPPDEQITASHIILKSTRRGVVGEFGVGDKGWPWFEVDFTDTGGKLVLCGFDIIKKIEAGPTPRFLLARLLEYMVGENK